MRKLSRPIGKIKPAYDVIVIGSGYGGSIAASRFSRAGLSVCLLEKGKEFQPGDYPDTLAEAAKEMQINAEGHSAKDNGLYNFHIGKGITVFKGCGLGGTSLVNANVSIKPEDRVFEDERWPAAIKNDKQGLEEGYAKAWHVLNPKQYPANTPGYPELAKSVAMKKSADAMKQPFRYTDINVTFEDGLNSVKYEQKKCNNCGDCVTGCNHSAKNTLIMNYLPDAVNHGAEIFCNINVKFVQPSEDGWLVYYDVFNTSRSLFDAPPLFVRANKLCIISGGALGSTEILMRSKENGLSVSPMLGKHFTGNGDMLGFAYNCDLKIHGIGKGKHFEDKNLPPVGPCITSIIDMRNQPNLTDGLTFEEGSIPGPLAGVVNESMLALSVSGKDTDEGFWDKVKEVERKVVSAVAGARHGATDNMQTYLIMSHDDGNGEMLLHKDHLDINWEGVGEQPIFEKASNAMEAATKALGGTYIKNVVWNKALDYGLVTVHPLGGCCMADDAGKGVTDDTGNVFTGEGGNLHDGLHVLDGAILPMPLGTNPLFTISAVTERACKLIIKKLNLPSNEDYPPMNLPDAECVPAVQFTETMKGFFSVNEKDDYEKAYDDGKQSNSPLQFTLTIKTGDMNAFTADAEHPGIMAGTVIAPALSAQPITVSNGIFNLFVKDADDAQQTRMKYTMQLNTVDNKAYYFEGYKKVENDKGLDMWSDTSTLYITVYDGIDATAAVKGRGILKIAPGDFAKQMTTMKTVDTKNAAESIKALTKFASFFSKNIIDTYIKKLL